MSNEYKHNETDLNSLYFDYGASFPSYSSGSNYKINGSNAFKFTTTLSDSDTWVEGVELPYYISGTSAKVIRRGTFPSFYNKFHSVTSSGTFNIKRTSNYLRIGASTYSSDTFKDGEIPKSLIVMLQGAGGGGHYGSNSASSSYSGAGGGGGSFLCVVLNMGETFSGSIIVGEGGAGAVLSTSTLASSGGDTYITYNGSVVARAVGGLRSTSYTYGGSGSPSGTLVSLPCKGIITGSYKYFSYGGNGGAATSGSSVSDMYLSSTYGGNYPHTKKTLTSKIGGTSDGYAGGGGASILAVGGNSGTSGSSTSVAGGNGSLGSGGGGGRNYIFASSCKGGSGGSGAVYFYY